MLEDTAKRGYVLFRGEVEGDFFVRSRSDRVTWKHIKFFVGRMSILRFC